MPVASKKPKLKQIVNPARPSGASPLSGAGLVSAFADEKGEVSIARAAEGLGLSKRQLAETIGLPRASIYREARLSGLKTQARAREMLEILGRVSEWAGGEKQALSWYRAEPLPSFGGRTAEALVKEGKGSAVRDYLDRVATGGFA